MLWELESISSENAGLKTKAPKVTFQFIYAINGDLTYMNQQESFRESKKIRKRNENV